MKLVSNNKVIRIQPEKSPVDVMARMIELRESGKVTPKTVNVVMSALRHEGFSDDQIVQIVQGSLIEKISFMNTLLLGLVFGMFIS